jgi:diguanylate cyclase (GGDEF)-like protein
MRVTHFFLSLALILLTTFLLSMAWELWLEDRLLVDWLQLQAREPTSERWEHVVSVMAVVSIAMVFPAITGYRLIAREQQLIEEIRRGAHEDYLTGLSNRRKSTEVIASEIGRCQRYGGTFTVILMDIDRFKEVNDTYGHEMGDRLLKETADLLRRMVRDSDSVGRWGGEEFLVVCPQTSLAGASALAEKLRRAYADAEFSGAIRRSASFGVTCYRSGDTVDGLVRRADRALYTAKEAGRNRVGQVD